MKDKDKLQEAILKADMKSAEKIWKELDGEQTLASLLEKMTKDELVKIAKKYDVKGITSLKKAEAVERIREVVINNEDHMINSLEETSIRFLQELINDDGVKIIYDVNKKIKNSSKYLMYFIPIEKGTLNDLKVTSQVFNEK